MKKRISAILVVALAIGLLSMAGLVAADDCKGDNANFSACHYGDYFTVTYLQNGQNGQVAGNFTTDVFAYAAAYLTENTYMTRSETEGFYTDLYFTGKTHRSEKDGREVDDWYTTWTIVIFDKATDTPLVYGDFYRAGVVADPSVVLPFVPGGSPSGASAPAAAPAAAAAAGGETVAVQAVPYSEGWEPTIVMPGTVQECLVRSNYTVRLRQAPTTSSPIMDSVPFGTSMPSDMRTADEAWVRAYYVGEGGVGKLGWVSADYVDLSDACSDVALAAPIGAGEVVAVAAAAAPAATTAEESAPAGEQAPTQGGTVDLTVVQPGTVPECLVRSNYTVRLRLDPSDNAAIADNVPYRTSMPADLLTSDDQWIRANYLGVLGWVDTSYLTLSDACADLNKIAPMP